MSEDIKFYSPLGKLVARGNLSFDNHFTLVDREDKPLLKGVVLEPTGLSDLLELLNVDYEVARILSVTAYHYDSMEEAYTCFGTYMEVQDKVEEWIKQGHKVLIR